jgi:hypothetical protein
MTLSDLADIQMGYPFRTRLEHDPDGAVAVIQMKDVDGERIDVIPTELMRVRLTTDPNRYLLERGDILFRSRGQTNTAALIAIDLVNTLAAAPLMTLRARSVARPDYLAWYLNQPASQNFLRSELKGTSVKMISTESLGRLEVVVPPLECQDAIVALARLGASEQELMEKVAHLRRRHLTGVLLQYAENARARAR